MSDLIKKEVLESSKMLFAENLVIGTAGNVSGRISPEEIVITPSSIPYEMIEMTDLVSLDMEGNQLSGDKAPSSEMHLHLECYKAYPEVGGVIHSHPKFATMFAVSQTKIPASIEETILYLGGDIEVAEYKKTGSKELAEHLPLKLRERSSVLMSNHGLLCIGKSPTEALKATQITERAAEVAWGSKILNSSPETLPEEVVKDFQAAYAFVRAEIWK